MENNETIIDYLINAAAQNGRAKRVLKNNKARSLGYIAKMAAPAFTSQQVISLVLKAVQGNVIQLVRSEPRLEWNESDYPVLVTTVPRAHELLDDTKLSE
ncbi:hypothetical protein ACRYI5_09905 [Furfurilactobacillus sp. WILCCON 0119]|uniref:hypothetical protein n=1 Tax=Furfurilactobacillus entadae TaxID=2922307 RepID=UPI0035F04C11